MGKNGPNSSLQEKIEGVMQQWEALENGLVVGFPMQWVQAWVMASVNQSLGEIDQDGLFFCCYEYLSFHQLFIIPFHTNHLCMYPFLRTTVDFTGSVRLMVNG